MNLAGLDSGPLWPSVQWPDRGGTDFEKTGLFVPEDHQHLLSDRDLAEWEAAVLEYRATHGDGDSREDDEDDGF